MTSLLRPVVALCAVVACGCAPVLLTGCGNDSSADPGPQPAGASSYASATDRLCEQMAAAVATVFNDAPDDPQAAMTAYVDAVEGAADSFRAVRPPDAFRTFHERASKHLIREVRVLREADRAMARGGAGAADAVGASNGLLPSPFPDTLNLPACDRGVFPAAAE